MPKRKTLKATITEAVLDQLPNKKEIKSVEEYIKTWWITKSGEGLRLTPAGDSAFRSAEIEYFDLPLKITQYSYYRFIADCNTKLKCPYFIGLNRSELQKAETYIRLYDSKIAMLVQLYGDVQSYLESVKVRK